MREKPIAPRRVRVERGIYRSPASGRLEIQYTDKTGKTRWRAVDGDLADARLARADAKLGYGPHSKKLGRLSFADVADEWFTAQTHLRPRTRELYATALNRHLLPRIGERPISTVDEDAIAQVIAELQAQGLAGWTIRGILVPLGRVLAYASRRKWIGDNPIRKLERSERPRVVRREMRILRPDEIKALLASATTTYRGSLATALFSGLRVGELL